MMQTRSAMPGDKRAARSAGAADRDRAPASRGRAGRSEGWSRQQFCHYLRQRREGASLSIEQIARTTKIPERSLRRIEAGLFEELPGDVFVRGFLRSYARCVGLDCDDVVRKYAQCGLEPSPVSSELAEVAAAQIAALADADREGEGAVLRILPAAASLDAYPDTEAGGVGGEDAHAAGSGGHAAAAEEAEAEAAAHPDDGEADDRESSDAARAPAAGDAARARAAAGDAPRGPAAPATDARTETDRDAGVRAPDPGRTPRRGARGRGGSSRKRRRARGQNRGQRPRSQESSQAKKSSSAGKPPATTRHRPARPATGHDAASARAVRKDIRAARRAAGAGRPAAGDSKTRPARPARQRTFLPPVWSESDSGARRGPLALAVIILVIVATLAMSYLLRRPSDSGDGVTRATAAHQHTALV